MTKKYYLNASGTVFAAVSLLHLLRASAGWAWQFGPLAIPLWVSWVAFLGAGGMAWWASRLHRG